MCPISPKCQFHLLRLRWSPLLAKCADRTILFLPAWPHLASLTGTHFRHHALSAMVRRGALALKRACLTEFWNLPSLVPACATSVCEVCLPACPVHPPTACVGLAGPRDPRLFHVCEMDPFAAKMICDLCASPSFSNIGRCLYDLTQAACWPSTVAWSTLTASAFSWSWEGSSRGPRSQLSSPQHCGDEPDVRASSFHAWLGS